MNPVRPSKKMKARSALSHALRQREDAEARASVAARELAISTKEVRHARKVAAMAILDARQTGVIS